MTVDPVRQIAQAVLYEGYLLWPYRRSARKNQQRWTFGGLFPQRYCADSRSGDPWLTRTECLVEADSRARLDVEVRFLQLVTRQVRATAGAGFVSVPQLTVDDDQRHLAGEESLERCAMVSGLPLDDLVAAPHRLDIDHPSGEAVEELTGAEGRAVGVVVRGWQALRGHVEISAERLSTRLSRITVQTSNTTPWSAGSRAEAAHRALLSAHTVLHADNGRFVSPTDPPEELRPLAELCRNIGAWPVLVGAEGDRHTVLSPPIILYDYPRIAPESPGDLFDATEIDQLLTLSILSLTEEEQREARDTDPRARAILDRCAELSPAQLMRLNGALREVCRSSSTPLEQPS
jgi:hypothetical protein